MKETIQLGQRFTHKGILYTCVGDDEGLVWGVENEHDESKGFDFNNCTPINQFNLSTI